MSAVHLPFTMNHISSQKKIFRLDSSQHKLGNHFSVLESEKNQTDGKLLAMQAPFPTVTVTTPDGKAASLTCVFLKR